MLSVRASALIRHASRSMLPTLRRGVANRKTITCCIVGTAATAYAVKRNMGQRVLFCNAEAPDNPWILVKHQHDDITTGLTLKAIFVSPISFLTASFRVFRMFFRCFTLSLRFAPLLVLYPVMSRVDSLNDVWWKTFLFAVQTSGPTLIKLTQWASTRRDIFTKEFCDRLSIMHTKTKSQRKFSDCEEVLDELFGHDFMKKHRKEVFVHIEPYSIGSGCIAQVYKATVNVKALENATRRRYPALKDHVNIDLAIKVAEKGVEQQIERDLYILKSLSSFALKVVPSLRFVDPLGALSQFEMVLRRQVDLRHEANALQKFAENFEHGKIGVKFPRVVAYNRRVIAETFEEGIYINKLVSEESHPELHARQSKEVRRRIALMGARALLKMIFVDNFVHGDMHPGNILIRFNDKISNLPGVHIAPEEDTLLCRFVEHFREWIGWRMSPRFKFTDSPDMNDEPTLVLLDTGIAISETPKNLKNLKSLFRAIVEKKGYEAGQLMLSQSPEQHCKDPHLFCKQVEALVLKARNENSLRTLNISALLSEMFSVVAQHRVQLDSSFTSVILSVMVLEGFGRSLDPDLDLFKCARPYLLNVLV